MRHMLKTTALTAVLLSTAATGFAGTDGYHTVNGYSDAQGQLGFDLTQIGGYGELTVAVQGFGGMGYGKCVVAFRRADDGVIAETAAVQQQSSATCPAEIAFTSKPADKGMLEVTFTEGGALKGHSYELFTVLRPYADSDAVTAPKNFDVLGMTIGEDRAVIEGKLKAEGFAKDEGDSNTLSYRDGSTRALEMWTKGRSERLDRAEDTIFITWTSQMAGIEAPEKVAFIGREWNIPESANLAINVLDKSLADKHGEGSMKGVIFYDRAGALVSTAYSEVCDEAIHLQAVAVPYSSHGMRSDGEQMQIACGAGVRIYTNEDFNVPGRAGSMKVELRKGDVAYADFWNTWSPAEAKRLQEAYELQKGMVGAAPKL
ncbi:hypothetical protein [Falsigemmobacter faecalis]|uniref:DUF4861 domain-containing protein n=1 Tax=Falsigemmobacter faecalis TaxID=2488730 RepID=A0A3P3DH17_9RHOB|nr:hypothetical protein [Falsigemmobacter faecalis]RRH73541.1 hypothetical protein EG244_12740 [Falsigemmobacter faecalis]